MMGLDMNTISFPGLGIGEIKINPEAFPIGSISVKWYAIFICVGLIAAFIYGDRKCESFGLKKDHFLDLVLIGVPSGLVGARLGYILMDLDQFPTIASMFQVWKGGLAIYGGIIAAFLSIAIACYIKKINMFGVFDLMSVGFLIGQIIGRWGNFFNVEVYGVQTNLPWGMGVGYNGIQEIVHPLFIYESIWNLFGLVLILAFMDKRKFKGEVFLWYTSWYGLGRAWMESMRNTEYQLTAGPIKLNQLIAILAVIIAVSLWVYFRFFKLSVHFEGQTVEKNLSFKEIRKLHAENTLKKEEAKYSSQFAAQLDEEAGISEEEFVMKEAFDKIDQMSKEEKNDDH